MAEERDYSQSIVSTKYGTHRFKFYLKPNNGEIEFTVDGYEEKNKVKDFKGNKIIFANTIELFINKHDVEFVESVTLSDADATLLKSERNILCDKIRKEKDKVKDWSIETKSKKQLMDMVDNHKKYMKKRTVVKNGVKEKDRYCVHVFRIGNETIRMIERICDGKVIINPDYKILSEFPTVGGLPEKEGELMVWKYYYELDEPSVIDGSRRKGFWETARPLRYSEQICYEIIKRYGMFHDYDSVINGECKKNIFGFLKFFHREKKGA